MARRIYRRIPDSPEPLKSNWPDQNAEPEHDYTISTKQELAESFNVQWEYLLYKGNVLIQKSKDYDFLVKIKNKLRHERGPALWIHKHEPSAEAAYEQRQRDKAEWRWNKGFGA